MSEISRGLRWEFSFLLSFPSFLPSLPSLPSLLSLLSLPSFPSFPSFLSFPSFPSFLSFPSLPSFLLSFLPFLPSFLSTYPRVSLFPAFLPSHLSFSPFIPSFLPSVLSAFRHLVQFHHASFRPSPPCISSRLLSFTLSFPLLPSPYQSNSSLFVCLFFGHLSLLEFVSRTAYLRGRTLPREITLSC